jgi:hypothetical protein
MRCNIILAKERLDNDHRSGSLPLRVHTLHARQFRHISTHDYIPAMADCASRSFWLSLTEFLTHLDTVFFFPSGNRNHGRECHRLGRIFFVPTEQSTPSTCVALPPPENIRNELVAETNHRVSVTSSQLELAKRLYTQILLRRTAM